MNTTGLIYIIGAYHVHILWTNVIIRSICPLTLIRLIYMDCSFRNRSLHLDLKSYDIIITITRFIRFERVACTRAVYIIGIERLAYAKDRT